MLYLLFGCVAFVFWFFLSLDNEIQRDFEIPVAIDNVPDSVVIISDVPKHINVVVQAKGSQLIPYMWGHMPELKLRFLSSATSQSVFQLSKARLDSRLRDYFGQSVQILSVRPDSIRISYTTSKGIKIPINIVADVSANLQSVINGKVTADVDSVTLYSDQPIKNIKSVNTAKVVLDNLKDTTNVVVALEKIPGIRMIPERVRLTIPVEPLIAKRRQVQVNVINLPDKIRFITFPSVVDVNYLVPMSKYNDDYPFKVYVDYNTLAEGSGKIKVNIAPAPEVYQNISLSYDSLEYVVEKRN